MTESETSKQLLNKNKGVPWKIYLSRALSAWGDRMWAFSGGVFVTYMDNTESLRLVAIYGFAMCLTVIIFGAAIGNWIDRNRRLLAAKVFLSIQNLCVIVCCSILAVYFWYVNQFSDTVRIVMAVAVVVVNCVAYLASVGSKIVVEKDWIVVIAGDDNNRLANINSVFRTTDLLCFVLAPILAGVLVDWDLRYATIFIAAWNLVSVCIEYLLLVKIYHDYPDLARKEHLDNLSEEDSHPGLGKRVRKSVESWKMYYQHPVRNAGVGLSLLYMTVLGFDNITYAYCLMQCIKASVLGGLVGISAVVGMVGSLSFPLLRKRINVQRAGMVGMISLVVTLAACVVSLWLPGSPFQLYFGSKPNQTKEEPPIEVCSEPESYWSVGSLLFGIIAARFGLWLADLSITQILQEGVAVEVRGTISGVQGGLNSFMDTIKFVLVIALPDEETFGWLVLASFAAIVLGWLSYSVYAIRNWNGSIIQPKTPKDSTSSADKSYQSFDNNAADLEQSTR